MPGSSWSAFWLPPSIIFSLFLLVPILFGTLLVPNYLQFLKCAIFFLPLCICMYYFLCMEFFFCPPWSVPTLYYYTGIISLWSVPWSSCSRFGFYIASSVYFWLSIHHIILICLFLLLENELAGHGECVLNLSPAAFVMLDLWN